MNESVFIVIPCYREDPTVVASTIEPLLREGYRVVLVDDGSPEPLRLPGKPVIILRHPLNRGQGAALQTGDEYALAYGAEAVVHFDGDGQHDAAAIPPALELLRSGQADAVLGSRFLRPEDIIAVPPKRRRLLRLARLVNGILTGVWLTDAHNGFRVLSAKALRSLDLREDRMAHATELPAQLKKAGLRWKELPIRVAYTEYSQKKGQRFWSALEILSDLLLERWL